MESVQNVGKIGFFYFIDVEVSESSGAKLKRRFKFMAGKSLALNFSKLGHAKAFSDCLWRGFSILTYCDLLTKKDRSLKIGH